MTDPAYTPAVLDIVKRMRKLTTGELRAVNEALEREWQLPEPPPDIGVREPRPPWGPEPGLEAEAAADRDEFGIGLGEIDAGGE